MRSGSPPAAALKAMPVIVEGRGMVLALVRGDHRLNEIKLRNALGDRLPPGDGRGDRGRARAAGVHRPGRRRGAGGQGRGDPGRRLLRRREPPRRPPDRGRARPRLQLHRARLPLGRGRRPVAGRRSDRDRDRDRGRQHLQARDPLLGAARRHLPRPGRRRAADRRWAATGSVRRGSSPPRSSRTPTRRGSSGRARRRPGRFSWSPSARRARRRSRPRRGSTSSSREAGLEPLYDDREAGPGEKLTDAELLGCPLRIVVGKRALAEGEVEAQERRSGADHRLAVADAARRAGEILDALG